MPPKQDRALGPPLQQGDLDYLCGLYTLHNSLRVCCGNRLSNAQLLRLIWYPLKFLDKTGGLLTILTAGAGVRRFRELLAITAKGLSANHPLQLIWRQPHQRTGASIRTRAYLRAMAEHLRQPNSAIIVLVDRPGGLHWTVISAITARVLVLWDSTGHDTIRLKDLKFRPRRITKLPVAIQPSGIFFIRVLPTDEA